MHRTIHCEICDDENVAGEEGYEEYDDSMGVHWALCRACHKYGNCSNDDGYCGDCN